MTAKLKTALLTGSTGLVGSQLLDRLIKDPRYGHIIALSCSLITIQHPKLEIKIAGSDTISEVASGIQADDWFSALGTTIKQAGSQEVFRRVDYDYPIILGRQAAASGAGQYLLVSALGPR
jgi:nucleoside-diphosphate-sugar epimerase